MDAPVYLQKHGHYTWPQISLCLKFHCAQASFHREVVNSMQVYMHAHIEMKLSVLKL